MNQLDSKRINRIKSGYQAQIEFYILKPVNGYKKINKQRLLCVGKVEMRTKDSGRKVGKRFNGQKREVSGAVGIILHMGFSSYSYGLTNRKQECIIVSRG